MILCSAQALTDGPISIGEKVTSSVIYLALPVLKVASAGMENVLNNRKFRAPLLQISIS